MCKPDSRAFTRTELMVVISVAVVLGLWAVLGFNKAHAKRLRIDCVNNLKVLGLAHRVVETNADARSPAPAVGRRATNTADASAIDVSKLVVALTNYANPHALTCPADRRRAPARSWNAVSPATISYFFNLEGSETQPQSWLIGDSNLTTNRVPVPPGILDLAPGTTVGWTWDRHGRAGNVALGDGSVQQITPRSTPAARLWVP
jgi:prepilin-type processing-associated H-X9-DG protein